MLDQRFATRPALYVLTLFGVLSAGRLAAQQPPPPPPWGSPSWRHPPRRPLHRATPKRHRIMGSGGC